MNFEPENFFSNNDPIGVTYAGNRLRALPKCENASLTLIQPDGGQKPNFFIFALRRYPESGSRKHFHALGVRVIDSPRQTTLIGFIFRKIIFESKVHEKITKIPLIGTLCISCN
jgi:hypothetical protein